MTVDERWNYHNTKLYELKKQYNKISKQTQNRLQEVFDSIGFTFDNIYNIADIKTKNRINIYIDEWKDKKLLKGYFGMLAMNIKNRTRVKNSEILELLIYSAYIEEQFKLNDYEINIFKDISNYYYLQGQQEVNKTLIKEKRKPLIDMTDILFLSMMALPNVKGYIYKGYIQTILKYNAEQIYRQATIDLQQQRKLYIQNDTYQNIIKRQQNTRLNIHDNKISGDIDLQLIGINNQAIVEGINYVDNNAKVMFVSDMCDTVTKMCYNMNGYTFDIKDYNVFDRYVGNSAKELVLERVKVKGLALGVNLPPINQHFHWCHSTIMYLPNSNDEKLDVDKKYSIFDSKFEKEIKEMYNINKARLKGLDEEVIKEIFSNMEQVYRDFPSIKNKIKEIITIEDENIGFSIQPDKNGYYTIEINKMFFKDENTANKIYANTVKKGFHPKGTTYKDLGVHEMGHAVLYDKLYNKYTDIKALAFDWNNSITASKIVQKAFKNIKVDDIMIQKSMIKNLSTYAEENASETIAEAFADYYANKSKSLEISKEIMSILKGGK